MVTLEKFGDSAIKFGFEDNALYLNNGEITVPLNALMLVIDESDLATFKKLNGDPFVSVSYADLGMDKDELEQWYKENMVGGTSGSSSGITPSEVQEMIDESISGKADTSALTVYFGAVAYDSNTKRINFYNQSTSSEVLAYVDASDFVIDGMIDDVRIETISGASYLVIDFNTASGKEDIMIPISDIFDASNYYTKAETDSAITASVSGKADTSAVTADIAAAVSGKQDTLIAGENITISGNVISASGGGASYVAGDGITIDSANTISATYSGFTYPSQVESEFYNRYEDFYMIGGYDCEGEDVGYLQLFLTEEDYNNGYNYIITLDMTAHTYSVTTEIEELNPDAWQDYLSISWDGNVNLFKATVLQELYYICDNYCGRVIEPQDIVIVHSGTTTNALDDAFSEIQTLNGNDITSSYFNLNNDNISFSIYLKNDTSIVSEQLPFGGGLSINVDGQLTTKMEYGGYGWHDAAINDGCCSDEFPPSSAVTFDISRNPAEYMDDGDGYNIMDSNGDAAEPTYYNVVNDNGHVTVTCVGDRLLTRICDNYCELDQYVSNLKYYGAAHIGTIPQAVNALEASLSGKQDTLIAGSGITISGNVISAEGGGSITIDPTLDSGSTNAVANSAITTAIDGINTRLAEDEEVTAAALNALNDNMGGLKLQQITQAAYDALVSGGTVDSSTLYVITSN